MANKKQKTLSIFLLSLISFFLIQPAQANQFTEENNYLHIERKNIKLNSRLCTIYDGYEYKIKNIYTEPIFIEDIIIWYNANGNVAFASIEKTKSQKITEVIQTSKSIALPTLGLSLVALPFTIPFSIVKNNIENKSAQKEAEKFDIIKQQKTFNIDKNQTKTIKTLSLKSHTPTLKILYKNPITDETASLNLK